MTRFLFKLHSLCLNSASIYNKLHGFRASQIVYFSTFSKSRNRKTQGVKETMTNISSLFREITDILGADDTIPDKTPSGLLIKDKQSKNIELGKEYPSCRHGVCVNTEVNGEEKGEMKSFEDDQLGESDEIDVSPIVHEITQIVRGKNGVYTMEELLEKSSFRYDAGIVEKVLKRCFKVPKLAFRFFNWVKFKDGFCHTTEIYNTMLSIVGEAKEFWLVEKLLEQMESNLCEKDIKTWTILINFFGRAKAIGKALNTFEQMKKSGCEPDVSAYKVMIRLLCTAEKSEIAMEFYRDMAQKDWGLDTNSYKLLLSCLARSGDVDSIRMVADDMTRLSQIPGPNATSCVLKCLCVSGRINEALELIRDCRDMMSDPENLETLVKGLCRANKIADALEIVGIMKKKHGVGAKIYEIIIDGYLRRNDLPKALELFESIKDSGHLPTTSTYTELIQHLFRLNKYRKGCEIYGEMVERGVELDSVAITAMAAGHARQNRISEAWEVFKSMEEKGIRATRKSYFIFVKELSKNSQTDEILKVLEYMQASEIEIGDEIIRWVITYLKNNGDMNLVEKVKQMQRTCNQNLQGGEVSNGNACEPEEPNLGLTSSQTEPNMAVSNVVEPKVKAYSEQDLQKICGVLSSSRDWGLIQEALEKCSIQFTPEIVEEVLRSCAQNGYITLCFFSWVAKQDGYYHTTETYNMAIKISGCGKDFKHMRSLFYEMRRKDCFVTSDTWTIMIMQYARAGLTDIALKNFREMKEDGYKPTSSTYKYVIIFLCGRKGRKVDEAIATFQEMLHAGYIPDKELVETYLDCLCEEGKLLDARKCAESLHKVGFTIPLCYSFYVRALCRAGKLEEALALVDEVKAEHSSLDQYVYGSVVHGLLQSGQLDKALAKVDSMKSAGINPTVHVYTSFIIHFFKEKQIERALEMFEKMQDEGCGPTIVTYSALIRGYMDLEKFEDAWDVFNRLKQTGPSPDFKTYSMFINCLCKVGRSEEALKLLSEMPDGGIIPSTVNFRTVFYGLNREGKQNLAQAVLQQKMALKSKRQYLS